MRSCTLIDTNRLRITTDSMAREYTVEVWNTRNGRVIDMTQDDGTVYQITVSDHRNPRQREWRCNCPAMRYRGGQCKHILALKAGLRTVGVKT